MVSAFGNRTQQHDNYVSVINITALCPYVGIHISECLPLVRIRNPSQFAHAIWIRVVHRAQPSVTNWPPRIPQDQQVLIGSLCFDGAEPAASRFFSLQLSDRSFLFSLLYSALPIHHHSLFLSTSEFFKSKPHKKETKNKTQLQSPPYNINLASWKWPSWTLASGKSSMRL